MNVFEYFGTCFGHIMTVKAYFRGPPEVFGKKKIENCFFFFWYVLSPQTFVLETNILVRLFQSVKGYIIEQKLVSKIAKISSKNVLFKGVQQQYIQHVYRQLKKSFFHRFLRFSLRVFVRWSNLSRTETTLLICLFPVQKFVVKAHTKRKNCNFWCFFFLTYGANPQIPPQIPP